MRRINNSVITRAVLIICLLLALSTTQVWAGGPVCRPPQCMPPMCAPPMMFCGPTVCPPPMPCPPPVCAPPMPCPPPVCAPPMLCPPPICKVPRPCPPPVCKAPGCGPQPCKENPLAKMFRGACDIVTGAIALPFAALDCMLEQNAPCGPRGGPCKIAAAPCAPPVCMPPMCGPGYGAAYGMGHGRRPMGIGRHAPRKMVPFAKHKSDKFQLFAGPATGIFGNYW